MCGRFTLTAPADQIRELFEVIGELPPMQARYNIAPTQDVLVVQGKQGEREARMMRWGLIPFWAKDRSFGAKCINARAETVADKPAFRAAFKARRCLIPTDGFYEWQKVPGEKTKTPYYVSLRGHALGAFAGIWERWKDPEGELVYSCSILTTEPNALVAPLHDRMPVFLDTESWTTWLDPEAEKEQLQALLHALPADRFTAHVVSREVNNVRNDGPRLIEAT